MDYALPPIVHPEAKDLLSRDSQELYRLTGLFGSPLNLVFPSIMQATVRQFRSTLDAAGQSDGAIFFAAKANKANAFLAGAAAGRVGVDVSSVYELSAALGNGVPGAMISVSGPSKPPALLALASVHDSQITIDEPAELQDLARAARALGLARPVRISLRLASVFEPSRFGMDDAGIAAALRRLSDLKPNLRLEGFSFHVPGYDSNDRIEMIKLACGKLVEASGLGLPAARIDIGGGFKAAYADPEAWSVKQAVAREFFGNVKPAKAYPYGGRVTGAAQLREILEGAKNVVAETSSKLGHPVVLDIEPGRAALEHAGMTVFRVRAVRTVREQPVVVVDGNSRDLADSFGNEFLVDPVLVSQRDAKAETFSAAIASNTCKEDDFLARRFVPLPCKPAPGDLLVYVNTAGYEMDSKESSFHRLPLPMKVAAMKRAGGWRFVTDQEFSLSDCLELNGPAE